MTDIIERLREPVEGTDMLIRTAAEVNATMAEAADEIERLRQRVEEFERAGGPVGDPRHKGYTLNYVPHQGEEIARLREQNAMLHKEIEGYVPWRELQNENWRLQRENEELRNKLITFNVAVDHVALESGKTRRTFSTGEGWAMVHKDRLLDLECAEEANERLQRENEELRSAIDEEMVATHFGVFNSGDDPVKAIKALMQWSQGVGEYFAREELKSHASAPVAVAKPLDGSGMKWLQWLSEDAEKTVADNSMLYTTPPTATALVEDFKRKIVWMLDTITADVRFQSKDCYRMADQLRHDIESLPLIEGEQG